MEARPPCKGSRLTGHTRSDVMEIAPYLGADLAKGLHIQAMGPSPQSLIASLTRSIDGPAAGVEGRAKHGSALWAE